MVMVQYIDICSSICKLNFEGSKPTSVHRLRLRNFTQCLKGNRVKPNALALSGAWFVRGAFLLREFSHFLVFCVKSWILTRRLH